jgi:hypothetical protein
MTSRDHETTVNAIDLLDLMNAAGDAFDKNQLRGFPIGAYRRLHACLPEWAHSKRTAPAADDLMKNIVRTAHVYGLGGV